MQMRIAMGLLLLLSLAAGAGAMAPGEWTHTGSFPFEGYVNDYQTWIAVNTTGFLYATTDGDWVQIFRPDGTPAGRLEQVQNHRLWTQYGVAVNSTDFVYVSKFSEDYEIVQIFDRSNQWKGSLQIPSGEFRSADVAVNATDFVYAFGYLYTPITGPVSVDAGNSVLVFNRDGTLVAGYNVELANNGATADGTTLVDVGDTSGTAFDRGMQSIGTFLSLTGPFDAAIDRSTGQTLITDGIAYKGFGGSFGGGVVRIFSTPSGGNPIGTVDWLFNNPSGIAVGPDGTLYVADWEDPYQLDSRSTSLDSPHVRNGGFNLIIHTFRRAASGPTAAFSGSPQSGGAPLTVSFLDYSTGATTWLWDFGDGTNSTAQNPTHVYTVPGLYTVSLTVANGAAGAATETKHGYIQVTAKPTADFEANVTSGRAALAVQFTSNTTGATAWTWYFGDGLTSSDEHPVHVYATPGVYGVWLVASNPTYGSVIAYKPAYIRVTDPPAVDFSMNVTNGTAPLAVRFTDLSTGNPFYWRWDFGDGGFSFEQHPTHTFTTAGNRTVTLTAYSANGSGQATHNVTVEPIVTPTPTVTVTPTATPTMTVAPTPSHTPYVPHALPTRVQAEDYDLGGEGTAYHDGTPGNIGGIYRRDDVDIERIDTGDPTPNVGWIRTGEWLTYTVNVAQAGTYDMDCRVSSNRTGRSFEVYLDGERAPRVRVAVPKTVTTTAATVDVPYTREWQYFTNVVAPIDLPAGTHTLRFSFPMDYLNLNWMEFTPRA